MEYRPLGASNVLISPICLGTMNFGERTDEAEAGRIVASARDAGVNFIDTADEYAQGESERIIGKFIAADRDWWVLATKAGYEMGDGFNKRGLSRRWIMKAAHDSLRRLNTEYVDIFYAHVDDEATPLEETLRAYDDLIRAGDIRYFGLSNYRSWRLAEVVHVCREMGVPRPIVCQPYYNAFNRMPEVEIIPACAHYGLGVVPYSPLARGVLTGKYGVDAEPAGDTRAGREDGMGRRLRQSEWRQESLVLAQQIKTHAESKGMTAGQYAINWVLNNTLISAVLPGPRTFDQWKEYLGALDHPFDAEDEALLDRLVPPGHPSTPGYSDPLYPIRGRIPRAH